MAYRPDSTDPLHPRAAALRSLLQNAPRDRLVAPRGQPFAFRTHRGRVRSQNEDTAIVLTGRRAASRAPFLGAIVCDGIGGLEHGAEAADLAAAHAGAVLASDEPLSPEDRMRSAIRCANSAIFRAFQGRAGAVIAAAFVEEQQAVIGWVGDARVYGLVRGEEPRPLTRDDTIAAEIERIEGSAPEAMDSLVRALGRKADVGCHVHPLNSRYSRLLLVSDGIHRMEQDALKWLDRHATTPSELADRLVTAALWEGGLDNATALVVDSSREPSLEEDGQVLHAWVEAQPRTWQILPPRTPAAPPPPSPVRSEATRAPHSTAVRPDTRPRKRRGGASAGGRPREKDVEQAPLKFEMDDGPGDKP